MINKFTAVLFECSRIYSLPMTVLSWLVAFTIAIINSGNIFYGLLALIGICSAHLGTNVLDDYLDYKSLIKQVNFNKSEYLKNTQKTKCRYIISGMVKESFVLGLACIYFIVAAMIGIFFYIKCGTPVLYFALVGGIIGLSYSFLSKIRLSELAVGVAYGPALFGGVYYVMTKSISPDIFILSIPTTIMTIILLYIHTVMDYDFDLSEGHQTVANSFNSQLDSLIVLKILMILSYLSPILICIFDISDWQVLLTYLTIPLSIDLYKSMIDYSADSDSVPETKWYHFPMENMKNIKSMNAESFMIRIYQSRNLMIYFSVMLAIGLVLSAI